MKYYDQFHDGSLDGLLIDQISVYVFLRTEEGQLFVVLASGVVAMAADGFNAGKYYPWCAYTAGWRTNATRYLRGLPHGILEGKSISEAFGEGTRAKAYIPWDQSILWGHVPNLGWFNRPYASWGMDWAIFEPRCLIVHRDLPLWGSTWRNPNIIRDDSLIRKNQGYLKIRVIDLLSWKKASYNRTSEEYREFHIHSRSKR
jgi:hypothetical protein